MRPSQHLLAASLLAACSATPAPTATLDVPRSPVDVAPPDASADLPAEAAVEILPRAQLDALVQPLVESGWLHGVVVGLVDARGVQIVGYGEAIDGTGAAPDGDTVFEVGSTTKTFTSLMLAREVVEGRLTLDQSVQSLLPDGVRVPAGARPITLKDLAVHGSGLPRLPTNLNPAEPDDPYADYTPGDLDDFLASYRLPREPGASFEYSNLAVGLLGRALSIHAGTSYEAALRARVLDPLGLRDTAITLSDAQRARFATPHGADGDALRPWAFTDATAGAGALRSTARDMLRYGAAAAGVTPVEGPLGRAIELATMEQQRWPDERMGLAWFFTADGRLWHNGGTGGFETLVAIDRAQRRAVVVIANTYSAWGVVTTLGLRLSALARGTNPGAWDLPRAVAVEPAVLQRYVGVYRLDGVAGVSITVTRDARGLSARLTGQDAFRLTPSGETDFFLRAVVARVRFEVDATGAWNRLRLDQNGRTTRATR